MLNQLHAKFRRPENGWDPVPASHAASYGNSEWRAVNGDVLDELGKHIGGFEGKKVLDLGGGPGQFSVAMAQRGALVTWHDISRRYGDMAAVKAREHGVGHRVSFSVGYLDEAPQLLTDRFDLVFNRICWNYAFDDRSFARVVFEMTRPGGWAYVDTTHSGYKRDEMSASSRLRTLINDQLGLKIGHPYPPRGRLERLFKALPHQYLVADSKSQWNDRILFQRSV
jgi:2-polyprenyl-3-methyl-5-hydroxy-6-metoxy-1,4-benzoquinol methylase